MFGQKKLKVKKKTRSGVRSNSNNTMTWQDKTSQQTDGRHGSSNMPTKGSMNAENMYNAVILPNKPPYYEEDYEKEKIEIHEWMAENTVDFFNELSVLINIVTEGNDEWQNVVHNGGEGNNGYPPNVKYYWKNRDEKPKELPVDVYIDHVMLWISAMIENEDVFPTDEDVPFAEDFKPQLQKIYKRMFRVFAIIYSNECLFKKPTDGNYLDLAFRHFMYYCWKWGMVDDDETKCIDSHVRPIKKKFDRDQKLYLEHKLPLVQISKHTTQKE